MGGSPLRRAAARLIKCALISLIQIIDLLRSQAYGVLLDVRSSREVGSTIQSFSLGGDHPVAVLEGLGHPLRVLILVRRRARAADWRTRR